MDGTTNFLQKQFDTIKVFAYKKNVLSQYDFKYGESLRNEEYEKSDINFFEK